MNLVGKIFVVLILVMSLVFTSLAVTVYATHGNWRDYALRSPSEAGPDKPVGLVHVIADLETRIRELLDINAALETKIVAQSDRHDAAIARRDSKYDQLRDVHDELEAAYAQAVQERRDAQSGQNAVQIVLGHLRKEIEELRVARDEAERDRDKHFQQVMRLSAESHQMSHELERLKKRTHGIQEESANLRKVIAYAGLPETIPSEQPPLLTTVVGAVRKDLVEIHVGTDDGILVGHRLTVIRKRGNGQKYVGDIIVRDVHPDRAVCAAVRNTLQSPIQRGDIAETRIERRLKPE